MDGSGITLPTNSLYTINPTHSGHLVETDPAFTDYRQWLGGDYMLSALQTDPNNIHKRLGDGYYEQKLINEQINRLTGFRRLDGYANDEEQFKALMNNGITAAHSLGLTVGIALSAEQIARLTSDIVWLENQTVTLPDGSTQTVLAPKVYVLARQGDVQPSGSLISADTVRLQLQNGTLNNGGTIAGRQVVAIKAGDIRHSGLLQAEQIGLTALDNLTFDGGTAHAGSRFIAQAHNIRLNGTTQSTGDAQNGNTVLDRAAAVYVRGDDTGQGILALHADNNIQLQAATLNNTAAQGKTQLSADGSLNISTVRNENHETYGELADKNHRHVHQSSEVGSQIQSKGDILLQAGQDLTIRQSGINSQNGTVALSAGNDVRISEGRQTLQLDASVQTQSKGLLSRSQTLDQYRSHHDEAVGSDIGGKAVMVTAGNDINVRGSSMVSDDLTALSAGHNVHLTAAQNSYQDNERHEIKKSGFTATFDSGTLSIGYNKSQTNAQSTGRSTTLSGSQIGSINGHTQIVAGNRIQTEASSIGAGQNLTLQAKDITLGDAYATETQHNHIDGKSSGFNISLNLKAPEVRQLEKRYAGIKQTQQQDNELKRSQAWHNGSIEANTEQFKSPIGFHLGRNSSNSDQYSQISQAIGTQVNAAGTIRIQATDGDVNIIGSQVFGQQGLLIAAKDNINIVAAEEHIHSQSQSSNKSLGIGESGNFSAFIGSKTDTADQQQSHIVHNGSTIGSGNGPTQIHAGAAYNQTGSQLVSGSHIDVSAQTINIRAADNPYGSDTHHTYTQKGLTIGVGSPVIQAIQTAQAANQSLNQIGQSKNTRTDIMAAANAGWQGYQAAQLIGNQSSPAGKGSGGPNITLTYGEQRNQSHSHTQGTQAQRAGIQADGQVNLTATGNGHHSDIRISGADIAGKQGTRLAADDQIHISAAEQHHSEHSNNSQRGWNAGVALDFSNGVSLGVTAGGNLGKGHGNGQERTHLHSHIGSAQSQTVIQSGGDTTLKGAQVIGKGVQIDAQNLRIESVQDTARYDGKQQDASAQVTVGYGFSASGSYSQSKINADHQTVTEQSGIYAGEDGYQINIKGHTDLKGGLITSTQSAEDNGRNQFATGTLSFSDIQNHSRYEGESFGLGASGNANGGWTGQMQNGTSSSVGYGSDSDSQNSITRSGINTQNIQISDEAEQIRLTGKTAEQTKAEIYTDVSTEALQDNPSLSGSLNNVFDKEQVQNELDLQRTVSQEFSRTSQQAGTEINRKVKEHEDKAEQLDRAAAKAGEEGNQELARTLAVQADNERRKAEDWQRGGVLLNMISAGLTAPTQSGVGIAAATASPALSYAIGQEFKDLAKQNKDGQLTAGQQTAHILAHAVLGAAVAAAGDNSAIAGAISAGGAEAAAPYISNWLYNETDGSKLTAEQKETVTSITQLLGTATGATIGNTTADAAQGSLNAQSAVENNFTIQDLGISQIAQNNLQQQTHQEANKFFVNLNSSQSDKNKLFELLDAYYANKASTAEVTAALGLGFNISVSINGNEELVLTASGTAGAGVSGFIGASTSSQSRAEGWYSEVCVSGHVVAAGGGCIGANLSHNAPLIHSMKVGIGIGLTPIDANANVGYQKTWKLKK